MFTSLDCCPDTTGDMEPSESVEATLRQVPSAIEETSEVASPKSDRVTSPKVTSPIKDEDSRNMPSLINDEDAVSESDQAPDKSYEDSLRRQRKLFALAICFVFLAIVSLVIGFVYYFQEENTSSVESARGGGDDVAVLATLTPSAMPSLPPPTVAPIDITTDTAQLVIANFGYDGSEFSDALSYRSRALLWLEGNANLETYDVYKKMQRYALACLYFSTSNVPTTFTEAGSPWEVSTGWLTDEDECSSWYGLSCAENIAVMTIQLPDNSLTGSLPREMTFLNRSLEVLDVSVNQIFNSGAEGNAWLGELTLLTYLDIHMNGFEHDGIPTEFGLLNRLLYFDCHRNLYSGPLDNDMWKTLTGLLYLDISEHSYSTSIPSSLASLRNLEYLHLVNSDLSGSLDFMGEYRKMKELRMDNNPLGSTLSTSILSAVDTLATFSVSNCSLKGTLPTEFGTLLNMKNFWVSNNELTGTVPVEYGTGWTKLEILAVEGNQLNGTIPEAICDLPKDQVQELSADCDDEITCQCCTDCY